MSKKRGSSRRKSKKKNGNGSKRVNQDGEYLVQKIFEEEENVDLLKEILTIAREYSYTDLRDKINVFADFTSRISFVRSQLEVNIIASFAMLFLEKGVFKRDPIWVRDLCSKAMPRFIRKLGFTLDDWEKIRPRFEAFWEGIIGSCLAGQVSEEATTNPHVAYLYEHIRNTNNKDELCYVTRLFGKLLIILGENVINLPYKWQDDMTIDEQIKTLGNLNLTLAELVTEYRSSPVPFCIVRDKRIFKTPVCLQLGPVRQKEYRDKVTLAEIVIYSDEDGKELLENPEAISANRVEYNNKGEVDTEWLFNKGSKIITLGISPEGYLQAPQTTEAAILNLFLHLGDEFNAGYLLYEFFRFQILLRLAELTVSPKLLEMKLGEYISFPKRDQEASEEGVSKGSGFKSKKPPLPVRYFGKKKTSKTKFVRYTGPCRSVSLHDVNPYRRLLPPDWHPSPEAIELAEEKNFRLGYAIELPDGTRVEDFEVESVLHEDETVEVFLETFGGKLRRYTFVDEHTRGGSEKGNTEEEEIKRSPCEARSNLSLNL